MTRTYDVVIVGGRVAGAASAVLLARAGLDVAVLERTSHGSDTLSTHALLRGGVLQLARWGILPEVVAAGTPAVRRTTFHHLDADPTTVTIRAGAGVDAFYAPRRHLLDRILVDAAAQAGADVRHGRAVTRLITTDGRVTGVRALAGDGAETAVNARWVIGADGIASTVARDVAAPVRRSGRAGSAVLYRYVADSDAGGYEWAYGAGAAAGLIPTNDGLACVFVATTPDRMRTLARLGREAAFDVLLTRAFGPVAERVRNAHPQTPLRGWAARPGFLRQAWGPGWALVGDAGYYKDPISAHGMTDALRDAELVARAVLTACADDGNESAAFAGYQRQRDLLSGHYFDAIDAIAGYDWDQPTVRRLLREAGSATSDEVEAIEGFGPLPQPTLPACAPARKLVNSG